MLNKIFKSGRKRRGFSFMEILVALVLIVSLSVGAFFMFNQAQQTRKMAQMQNDMDNIVMGLLTYESLNINSQLPASLPELVTGLNEGNSIDGARHENLVRSTKAEDGNFLDPWGQSYSYNQSERTLSCTPQNAEGEQMETVTRYF